MSEHLTPDDHSFITDLWCKHPDLSSGEIALLASEHLGVVVSISTAARQKPPEDYLHSRSRERRVRIAALWRKHPSLTGREMAALASRELGEEVSRRTANEYRPQELKQRRHERKEF